MFSSAAGVAIQLDGRIVAVGFAATRTPSRRRPCEAVATMMASGAKPGGPMGSSVI